jgi:hypothetical protein
MNWIILLFCYIIPMILTVVVIYNISNEVTRGDLIGIILAASVPLLNFFVGYVGGLVSLCQSKTINDFLNTRIK